MEKCGLKNDTISNFKYNSGNSKYARHLIENGHSIGPINESMTILPTINNGKMMDTLEKFHIYNITKANNQINDRNTVTQNILVDVVLQQTTSRRHPENLV